MTVSSNYFLNTPEAESVEPAPKHIYISGPMRAHDAYNFPAFFEAERVVRSTFPEADICNPAREDCVRFNLTQLLLDDSTGYQAGDHLKSHPELFGPAELRVALKADLDYITEHCDLIVLLPGWRTSTGAKAELAAAEALGIPTIELSNVADEPLYTDPAVAEWAYVLGNHARALGAAQALIAAGERIDADLDWSDPVYREEPVPENYLPGETRTTSATGGQKGTKLADFSQIPIEPLTLLAEHFGKGARKYAPHNYRRGYEWSKSYAALMRHLTAFWNGEDYDEETGSLHIVAVAWHAFALTEFYLHHPEYDDRFKYEERTREEA